MCYNKNAVQRASVRHILSTLLPFQCQNPAKSLEPIRLIYLNYAVSVAGKYPDCPKKVAHYHSSRFRNAPSVTGLEGLAMAKVFNVFEDDHP